MIEWNRVTWYSKACAIVLFLSVFALGGYLGYEHGKLGVPQVAVTEDSIASIREVDTSTWSVYTSDALGIEFKLPANYEAIENYKGIIPDIPSAVLLIREKGKETSGNTIAFTKTRNTLPDVIKNYFSWRVASIEKVPSFEDGVSYVLSFFSGDAYTVDKTYLFTKWSPASPFDDGASLIDILIAEVDAGRNDVNTESTLEVIASTIRYTR